MTFCFSSLPILYTLFPLHLIAPLFATLFAHHTLVFYLFTFPHLSLPPLSSFPIRYFPQCIPIISLLTFQRFSLHAFFFSFIAFSLPASALNAPCLLIGDSIAQGASAYAPECSHFAQKGISSSAWRQRFERANLAASTVLISLGTNDGTAKTTLADLVAIRSRINASKVIWIAPGAQFPARTIVIQMARSYGDDIYERPFENLAGDNIHFSSEGYARIGSIVRTAK